MGNRLEFLQNAINELPPKIKPLRASSVYESEAWGYTDQGKFLNMALEAETELSPQELLIAVKQIEKVVGRRETFKNGPREIDIDILFYDRLEMHAEKFNIPHSDIPNRSFVLTPLAELIPDFPHPALGSTILDLQDQLGEGGSELTLYPEGKLIEIQNGNSDSQK